MSKMKFLVVISLILVVFNLGLSYCDAATASAITIERDKYGVPHIFSKTLDGLYYGFGYVVAQDRLFQLEMLKRTVYGQLSEVYGEDYLPLDIKMRRESPTQTKLQALYDGLDATTQYILKSYTDGINAWIEKALQEPDKYLPQEFIKYGIKPTPWTVLDATTPYICIFGLFMDLNNELDNANLYNSLVQKFGEAEGAKFFDDMVWVNDPGAVTTIQGTANASTKKGKNQVKLLNKKGISEALKKTTKEKTFTRDLLQRMGYQIPTKVLLNATQSFSNSLVISPAKSQSKEAMLMGGPQFDFWLPSHVHEVGLHGAGIDAVGSTLVGNPFIMFGFNKSAAITSTAGAGNIVDIFEEKLNPKDPTQYLFNGKWVKMEQRVEKIAIKDKPVSEEVISTTVHGPVIMTVDTDGDGKVDVAYSRKMACADNFLDGITAYFKLMIAESPNQFEQAAKICPLSLNYLYADTNGHIGYFHCGEYPIRSEEVDVRFPTPGTGEYEWRGFLAEDDHPHIIDPATGFLVNWNNKPISTFDNGDLSGILNWTGWGPDHRAQRFIDLANSKETLSVKDIEDIVHDTSDYDLRTIHIMPYLMEALNDTQDPTLKQAKTILSSWNCARKDENKDGYYDNAALTLFSKWWVVVNTNIFSDELGDYLNTVLNNYGGYSLFYRLLQGDKATLPLKGNYLNGTTWKKVFVDSLKQAIDELAPQYGTTPMDKWLTQAVYMGFPPYNLYGVRMSDGTVGKIPYMDRGSQNHIVLLKKNGPEGQNVLPAGQNAFIDKQGQPGKHFNDQIDLFANWKYKKMLMSKDEVTKNLETSEILNYNGPKNNPR